MPLSLPLILYINPISYFQHIEQGCPMYFNSTDYICSGGYHPVMGTFRGDIASLLIHFINIFFINKNTPLKSFDSSEVFIIYRLFLTVS